MATEPTTSASAAAGTRQTMEQRYGTPRGHGRAAVTVLAVVLGVATLLWIDWVVRAQETPRASAVLHSYTVASPHVVDVTLDVSRSDHGAVRCTVTAEAVDHTVVGAGVVSVPPGTATTITAHAVIRTSRAATTATVAACR